MATSREPPQAAPPDDGGALDPLPDVPCTRNRTRICELLSCLTACNRILWKVGVQLEENERDKPGDVSVAMVVDSCRGYARCVSKTEERCNGQAFLQRLLAVHSCIVAIEVNHIIADKEWLLNAISRMRSLRRLTISGIPSEEPRITESIGELVRSMDFITELSMDGYSPSQATTSLPGLLLERPGIALTTLDVAGLEISAHLVRHLTMALIENNTVTELAVGAFVFASGQARPFRSFAEYLGKEKGTLRKLTLRAPPYINRPGLETIVRAICNMNTLEELIADWNAASVAEYNLFSKVVAKNRSLRVLSVPCSVSSGDVRAAALRANCFAAMSRKDRISRWLRALSCNNVLEKLTIDLQWLTLNECEAFLEAVAGNRTLKTVTVRYLTDDWNLDKICLIIRERRLTQKVRIQNYHLGRASVLTISQCPEVTALILRCPHIARAEDFSDAFKTLASCSHVTSLYVYYEDYSEMVFAALTAYIQDSYALKSVELYLPCDMEVEDLVESVGRQRSLSVTGLVQALSENLVINKVTLELPRLSETDCTTLAEALVKSQSLYELCLSAVSGNFCAVFLRCILRRVEQNYTLLHFELRDSELCHADMFTVQDVARRNSNLLNRAARLVMGDHDACCARAIEFVSQHPKLVEVVKSRERVDDAVAKTLIRRASMLPMLTSLDGYMVLAGVVRHSVVCQAPVSAPCAPTRRRRLQLDDLNFDCWFQIRKYLKVADVVGP